jgi:BASS family bile acid:Na+ symporter
MIATTFFSTILLPFVLAMIMLGMGLSLTTKDFINIFARPKALAWGLTCQLILLPLIALGIARISGLSPELQVGIVLIAACPGGAVSNLITHLLGGALALSVSMTTVNSFITMFTIPVIIKTALWLLMDSTQGQEIVLPFWTTLAQVMSTTVLPCVLGIYIRQRNETVALRLERPLKVAMPSILALVMIAAIFLEEGEGISLTTRDYWEVSGFAFLLNIAGMLLGYWSAAWLGFVPKVQMTIAIEVGLQNTGMAIFIATSRLMLNNQTMAIPASIYALFTFFTAIGFGWLVSRNHIQQERKLEAK